MKPNEEHLYSIKEYPITIVTASGERIKVRSHDHMILPPLIDENGNKLEDNERSEFFQVWSDGRHFRWVAFTSINIIEAQGPIPA